jgi:hypothetical protein
MAGHADDLPFRVELWDDKDSHIEEVIALASDYATARSAYEEAVKQTRQAHHVAAEGEGHSKEPMTCNANAASSYSLRLSAMGITSLAASNAIAGRATRALLSWISRLEIFRLSETVGKHLTFDDETWQAMHDLESDIDQFC